MAIVYLHQNAVWNLELSATNLEVDVLLNPAQPKERFRIRIHVNEIWNIQLSDSQTFTDCGRLFYAESVFKKMLTLK